MMIRSAITLDQTLKQREKDTREIVRQKQAETQSEKGRKTDGGRDEDT